MTRISKVSVIMGSNSDLDAVKPCIDTLNDFGVNTDVHIISAHRTPAEAHEFSVNAKKNGTEVIIAAAGKAAHLAGVIASLTTLPVIALPMGSKLMGGLDSLLSMVQMPKGVPVACVGVDAGENAAVLAVQILSIKYPELAEKLDRFKIEQAEKVNRDNKKMQESLSIR